MISKGKDFFENGFNESTLTKLLIFEKYIQEWIPVFLNPSYPYKELKIYDFFAGPGYDTDGLSGSPIRILNMIDKHYDNISAGNKMISILLNDDNKKHFEQLQENCKEYLENSPHLINMVRISYYNEDANDLLQRVFSAIGESPSLVLMDQFGLKHVNYIEKFAKCDKTDFIYFISSSFAKRFAETSEFRKALNLTEGEIKDLMNCPHKLIHDNIVNLLRQRIQNSSLRLYPFSLKKGSSIYGLIFGAKHPRAFDKFLRIAWSINPENGRADYDINEDVKKREPVLWAEGKESTTVELFQERLSEKILNKEINNNVDAYYFMLEQGHISAHATEALKSLKKRGKISFDAKSPLINYENAVKKGIKVKFNVQN
jgi:three-Cys-motif partner protein